MPRVSVGCDCHGSGETLHSARTSVMPHEDTITVIVPAFNEAANLEPTIEEVERAVAGEFADHEILIVDDASTDGTGAVADRAAERKERIRVFHNERNRGLGWNYRLGIGEARMEWIQFVNGKHDISALDLKEIFRARERVDVVIPYHVNGDVRHPVRRALSAGFTGLLNVLFGLRIRYYNDAALHRADRLKALTLRSDSYALQAEAIIKQIKRGAAYVEVPTRILSAGEGSRALRPGNFCGVVKFLVETVGDVYFRDSRRNES